MEAVIKLRKLMGYVNNASDREVKLSQDDATGSVVIVVGKSTYSGYCLGDAIDKAYAKEVELAGEQ